MAGDPGSGATLLAFLLDARERARPQAGRRGGTEPRHQLSANQALAALHHTSVRWEKASCLGGGDVSRAAYVADVIAVVIPNSFLTESRTSTASNIARLNNPLRIF